MSAYKDSCIIESFNGNTSNYGYSNNHFSGREMLNEINYYDNYSLINSSWMPGSRTSYLSWQSSPLDARFINATDANLSVKGLMTGSISFLSTNQLSKKYTVYYYDKNGRVVQKNATNHFNPISNGSFGGDQYAYSYDFKGNVLHVRHKHRGTYAGTIFIEGAKSEYDHAGRLIATKQYVSSESSAVTTSRNAYNELGQLSTKVYGNNLETQTYNYNIRGWLKEINGDMFAEKLYYERDSQNGAACYNGNICESSSKRLTENIHTSGWKLNPSQWKEIWSTYNYVYDNLNRLTQANSNNNTALSECAAYDKHGNITSINRRGITEHYWGSDGMTPSHSTAIVDNLSFNAYNGNQLLQVADLGSSVQLFTGGQDFKDLSTKNYTYDANGNLNSNFDKNITSTHYNFLNLPDTLQMRSGHMVTYGYDDATGAKTFVTRKTATGSTTLMPIGSTLLNNTLGYTIASTDVTMYIDNIVHETSTYYLDKVMISDGMLKRTNAITETTPVLKYHYFLKDHLGNVRVVFDEDGIIKQVNNYYPFGMEWGESAEDQTSMTYQNNLFGGKEFDRKFELNTYDFEARNYDATIGRWTTPDPLAEKYYSISPYAYCANNPIKYVDYRGDSLSFADIESIKDIYHGLADGTKISMKFNNGVLDPSSIAKQAENTSDVFLRDLYEIATNSKMVELSTSNNNTYVMNGETVKEEFSAPSDFNTSEDGPKTEALLKLMGLPTGNSISGIFGQTLIPGNESLSEKSSTNSNVQIIINGKGSLNHQTVGIAHEFGHAILYLRKLSCGHGQPGVNSFINERSDKMKKKLGYDF